MKWTYKSYIQLQGLTCNYGSNGSNNWCRSAVVQFQALSTDNMIDTWHNLKQYLKKNILLVLVNDAYQYLRAYLGGLAPAPLEMKKL